MLTILVGFLLGLLSFMLIRNLFQIKTLRDDLHDLSREKADWEERYCALIQEPEAIEKIVEEEIKEHENDILPILKSAYESHYAHFREQTVNGFMDRATEMAGDVSDALTNQLMQSVQPIFNDIQQNNSFILPNGVRHAFQKGKKILVLIESPPGLRTITFTNGSLKTAEKKVGQKIAHTSDRVSDRKCYRFNLSFPFTYFMFLFNRDEPEKKADLISFNVYFRSTPLSSLKQNLYPAPLLNLGDSDEYSHTGYVCMGDNISSSTNYKSIAQMCDAIIGEWWSRAFHNDLNEAEFRNGPLGNIVKWQEKSNANPLWACGVKWKNGRKTKHIVDTSLLKYSDSSMPSIDCRSHVESAAYEVAKQINHAITQCKPDEMLTLENFEETALRSYKNNTNLLTKRILERITCHS